MQPFIKLMRAAKAEEELGSKKFHDLVKIMLDRNSRLSGQSGAPSFDLSRVSRGMGGEGARGAMGLTRVPRANSPQSLLSPLLATLNPSISRLRVLASRGFRLAPPFERLARGLIFDTPSLS